MNDGRLLVAGALVGLALAKAAQGSRGVVRTGRRLRKKIPSAVPGERPPSSPYRADGTAKDEVDEHAVHELVITTTSDGDLYSLAKAISATLAKHLKKDRFDRVRAAKAFEALAEAGARKIGWDQHEQPRAKAWQAQKIPVYYPAKVRRAASWDLFEHYVETIESLANEG